MSTQRQTRRPRPIRRRVAFATAAITALAIAAPIAGASADTPGSATGPTLAGDVFNGGTVIVTSPSPAVGEVIGAP